MSDPPDAPSTIFYFPPPQVHGSVSFESCLSTRRSVRDFSTKEITVNMLGQLLWSIQGVTGHASYKRTPPSAGGLHPLNIDVVIGAVDGLMPGIYRYLPKQHSLKRNHTVDVRMELGNAALDQTWLSDAAVSVVISAIYEKTTRKYGERGYRYVHMDSGFAAENLHLQAVALGLGTVVMGAFSDDQVHQVMNLSEEEKPLLILPIGWPKS